MKLALVISLALLGILSGCSNSLQPLTELSGFEKEVDSLQNLYHNVGAAVAILKDGKVVYQKGFGYRDLEQKLPVTSTTVFGIGSCTKAFTAALFDRLQEEGRLKLTDRPHQLIPELAFYSEGMNDSIQLKHILSHSTGLPGLSTESTAVLFRSEDKNAIIPRLKYLPPQAGVGDQWIYNNLAYALAGRLTEAASGKSWQENLAHYFFQPLEMNQSYGSAWPASKDSEFALGYGVSRQDTIPMRVLIEDFPTRDAGGNIYSTVQDMAKWLSLWLSEGKHNEAQFLTEDYFRAAIGEQQLMQTDSLGQQTHYGYGWMRSRLQGHLKIEHSGGISGYSSNVVFFPEDDLGIIVLSNQNTAGIAFAITNNLIERLLKIQVPHNPNEPYFSTVVTLEDPTTPTIINEAAPPDFNFKDITGSYSHPGFGTIEITYEGQTLYAEVPFTKFRLQHDADNRFLDYFTERKSQVVGNFLTFTFERSKGEVVDQVLLNIDQEPVAFNRD